MLKIVVCSEITFGYFGKTLYEASLCQMRNRVYQEIAVNLEELLWQIAAISVESSSNDIRNQYNEIPLEPFSKAESVQLVNPGATVALIQITSLWSTWLDDSILEKLFYFLLLLANK